MMKFDSQKFRDWYKQNMGDADGAASPGTWVAIDPNQVIVDHDANANELLERLEKMQPNPSIIRVVYSFPRNFV
jgi:hypothetical protein